MLSHNTSENSSEGLGRQRNRLNLLDLRFFIITMALRNIRISISLCNRIKVAEMPSAEVIWVGKGANMEQNPTEIQRGNDNNK